MASTIVVPTQDVLIEAKVVTALTAAATDIAALQLGTTALNAPVANGASLPLTSAHNRKTILLDTAAGTQTTLPAATGSGIHFNLVVSAITTASGANTISCVGNDTFVGTVFGFRTDSGNAAKGFATVVGDNTIILNHAGKGGAAIGDWFKITDVAADVWFVRGMVTATGGAAATVFSTV